jgi:hypothetical protein
MDGNVEWGGSEVLVQAVRVSSCANGSIVTVKIQAPNMTTAAVQVVTQAGLTGAVDEAREHLRWVTSELTKKLTAQGSLEPGGLTDD